MSLSEFATIFGAIFLAELGDKTQLATVLFASDAQYNAYAVFLAASLALIASSALATVVGANLAAHVNPQYLSYAAGVGFIVIGVWTLWSA